MVNRKLAAYRKLLGLTQKHLAEQIGISLVSLNHKETGKRKFTQDEMVAITNIIKEVIPEVTMNTIFFDDELSDMPSIISQ